MMLLLLSRVLASGDKPNLRASTLIAMNRNADTNTRVHRMRRETRQEEIAGQQDTTRDLRQRHSGKKATCDESHPRP